ncbi:MAG: hypothetical protein ACE5JI_02095 [Acidobacteriota bacterium]
MWRPALLLPSFIVAATVVFSLVSCNELREPVPTAPGPVPLPAPSQFSIVGHWEATSSQGRRIAFDVTADGRVMNGRINLHHDCNTGRWRATFDGFQAPVVANAFITTVDWRTNDNGLIRAGSYTVSGRFEADDRVIGGLINSVNDVRRNEQPTGDVCPSIQVTYEGNKAP